MIRILVTGADGFIGSTLVPKLTELSHAVEGTSRSGNTAYRCDVQEKEGWDGAVKGKDVVIHLAARAHKMADKVTDPLAEFRRINVGGTKTVAAAAAAAGVKRFVLLSSIKVLGEQTEPGSPFHAGSAPAPEDDYGISKAEAEEALFQIGEAAGMEVVAIRPPLVYGPGVKGNLATLSKSVRRGIPLPFGSIRNRRDLVGIDNLCELIAAAITHPAAAGRRLLVSDGEPVSTPELVRAIAQAQGRPSRILPLPKWMLSTLFRTIGRKSAWERISGNLEVDLSDTRSALGWEPNVSFREGISRAFTGSQNNSR